MHVPMQLLVVVINHAELVDDVLAGFVELGITGATVLESKGMGRVLAQEVPIFAGLRTLNTRSRTANRTIFCVADDVKVAAAIRMIEETCGDLGHAAGRARGGAGARAGRMRAGAIAATRVARWPPPCTRQPRHLAALHARCAPVRGRTRRGERP
jgi:hypothetical protein